MVELVALGVITRAFGLRGEVKVKPYNPRTEWFDHADGVWIQPRGDDGPRRIGLLGRRWHKDLIVLKLEGVRDRDQAEALQGLEVFASESELPPLEDGEYYWRDLIGLEAETADGTRVGTVVRMEETAPALGGNDVFVIETPGGELLVPASDEAVEKVDLDARKIIIAALFVEGNVEYNHKDTKTQRRKK